MKKILSLLLCFAFLLPAAVRAEGTGFSDVKPTDWFFSYVDDLTKSGVVNGYPDGTFRPDAQVKVNEALKLILLAAGYPPQAPTGAGWASGYLTLAMNEGFLNGEAPELSRSITRTEVAHLAARALALYYDGTPTPFSDTDDPEITALYGVGVIQGENAPDGLRFSGDRPLRRSEVSAIVWRIQRYCQEQMAAAPVLPEDPQVILALEGGAGEEQTEPSQPLGPTDPGGNEEPVPEGKIRYRDKLIDIMEDVPVFAYDPKTFYLENGRMRCSDRSVRLVHGIDVSSHQGIIDWNKVKADGVDFAIIRAGYRGYTVGNLVADPNFGMNIRNALAAGIEVGVYVFSQAITEAEALEEADFVLDAIRGYNVTLPVVFDWEIVNSENARTRGLSTAQLMACTKAFCRRVQRAGYAPMVYFNADWGYLNFDLSQITQYDFWLAQYKEQPDFYYNFKYWQYTSKGSVNGISGNVDLDVILLPR